LPQSKHALFADIILNFLKALTLCVAVTYFPLLAAAICAGDYIQVQGMKTKKNGAALDRAVSARPRDYCSGLTCVLATGLIRASTQLADAGDYAP
jgi:hypothetical protein